MEYIITGVALTVVIFIVYMILSSRINSNLNKLDQKIQDLRYERQESILNMSQRVRAVETSIRDTERLLRSTTVEKVDVRTAKGKQTTKITPASKSGITKTTRDVGAPVYSRNSSEDTSSPTMPAVMMAVYQTSESSRAESCSSSSSYDSGSSSSSSSSYDSGSSSSSSCDSSSSF